MILDASFREKAQQFQALAFKEMHDRDHTIFVNCLVFGQSLCPCRSGHSGNTGSRIKVWSFARVIPTIKILRLRV